MSKWAVGAIGKLELETFAPLSGLRIEKTKGNTNKIKWCKEEREKFFSVKKMKENAQSLKLSLSQEKRRNTYKFDWIMSKVSEKSDRKR